MQERPRVWHSAARRGTPVGHVSEGWRRPGESLRRPDSSPPETSFCQANYLSDLLRASVLGVPPIPLSCCTGCDGKTMRPAVADPAAGQLKPCHGVVPSPAALSSPVDLGVATVRSSSHQHTLRLALDRWVRCRHHSSGLRPPLASADQWRIFPALCGRFLARHNPDDDCRPPAPTGTTLPYRCDRDAARSLENSVGGRAVVAAKSLHPSARDRADDAGGCHYLPNPRITYVRDE